MPILLRKLYIYIPIISLLLIYKVAAQGCVAVRQMGGQNINATNSYNLEEGEFQVGTNYRYFHSWRHFIGKEEQLERQTTGGGHDANGKNLETL